jgi:CubicO group peptidase (beta-lactamase class C family)
MKKLPFLYILVCLLGLSTFAIAQDTPEEQGISSRSIVKFIEALEKAQPDAIHSVMIRRHGLIVSQGWWAPYAPETPHLLWSLSKSFTSTAIGLAQDEGLLSIDDLVISFFPEDIPEKPSANLKAMRISDLLRMNTGQAVEPSFRNMQSDNWVSAFLAHKVDFKPGTHFKYNSMATYMCSAILQKVTGMTMVDYLTPRLFESLGIQKPTWESDPRGINVGGWGLSVRTEDISKLGQLYLQKGMWEGKQLLSEAWVEAATSNQTSNGSNPESDWDQGYGYQFWQCRYNAYRGDGAFGQYCLVMPEQDAVIAITAGSDDLQGILDVVWEYLLPAMKEGSLPPDEAGLELLHQKQQGLAISYVAGEESSPLASDISGKVYKLEENIRSIKSISFNFESSPVDITISTDQGERSLNAAFSSMEKGIMPNPQLVSDKVAVNGAWESPDTYVVNLIYYETPQSVKHTFTFKEKSVLWDTEQRASFGSRRARPLKATL